MSSGVLGARLLKTTQSGYEGFLRDEHTGLPDTRDRILATALDAEWSYERDANPDGIDFDELYAENRARVDGTLLRTSPGGVYSPSVQHTLYQMGAAVVERAKEVRQVTLTAPNLHFIPARVPGSEDFDDDVCVATSEPRENQRDGELRGGSRRRRNCERTRGVAGGWRRPPGRLSGPSPRITRGELYRLEAAAQKELILGAPRAHSLEPVTRACGGRCSGGSFARRS